MKALKESLLGNTKDKVSATKKRMGHIKLLGSRLAVCQAYANVLGDEYFNIESLDKVNKGKEAFSDVVLQILNDPFMPKGADPVRMEGLYKFLIWLDNLDLPKKLDWHELSLHIQKRMKKDNICNVPCQLRTKMLCGGLQLRYEFSIVDAKINCSLIKFEINGKDLC
jgi:hypothetical protein